MGKVYLRAGAHGEAFVITHFFSLIIREGFTESQGKGSYLFGERLADASRIFRGEHNKHRVASGALYQCAER